MKTQWVFNNCGRDKRKAQAYWEKKAHRLNRLMSNYRPELRRIRLTVYRHDARDEWEMRGVVHLPTGTLVSEETCATLHECIDKVADELAREIRRHKSKVRKDHLYRRRRRRRQQLSAAGPYLAQDASDGRKDAFVAMLLPLMDQVCDHARRELRILVHDGTLPKGEWYARDLVDDVLVRACESFGERPNDVSLDVWRIELLHQRLQELCQQIEPVSLAASSSRSRAIDNDDNEDLDDIQYWRELLLEPPEELSLEELLPDDDVGDMWDELSAQEQRDGLKRLLWKLPKHQRQALMLHDAQDTGSSRKQRRERH